MSAIIKDYVQDVLQNLVAEEKMKRRIEQDLYTHITELSGDKDAASVIKRMGPPEDVAREFMNSIYEDESPAAITLIQERMERLEQTQAYEYRSRVMILGLPLVHIHTKRSGRPRVAKGIIAIGDIAIGLVAIGALALGGISIGAVSLGMLALGGLALGGMSLGGLAIGLIAIGGLAVGQIAMGGLALGNLAIGGEAIGDFTLIKDQDVINQATVSELFRSAYPGIKDWMLQIFTWFFKS